jgi:hypothetical protein
MSRQGGCNIPYGGQEHVVRENYEILCDSFYSQFFWLSLIMGRQVLEILDWPSCDRMADPASLTKWNRAMFLGYVRPHGSNPATCAR